MSRKIVRAVRGTEQTALFRRGRGGRMLVVARTDHPADLEQSINARLRYPQRQLLAWDFGIGA
ncbi:MAG: hypothetical protein SFX73_00245 [Kofleriaceae bacterium]|nr:hypothetical protein [Kofleriaceae bacterium]